MSDAILPDADWRKRGGLQRVVAALRDGNGGPRLVGGAVRDGLLRLPVSDIDLATPLLPGEVIDRLEAVCIKAVPTGIDHGTVTAVTDDGHIEITTLRRDVATDGRRATVAFATEWREDAERRDFTINALYADPVSGQIFDYFAGLTDLDSGLVRFIGDADQRIREDYLRILRFFRFHARYGAGAVDEASLAACARGAHGLTALSRERIAMELTKLLLHPDPVQAISLMQANGIFAPFFPELEPNATEQLSRLVGREQAHKIAPSLPGRLLCLLPVDLTTADRVAARLKLSNRLRESLAERLKAEQPRPPVIRAIAYRHGIDCARDVAMLRADDDDLKACLALLEGWEVPTFDLKGGELIAMGLDAGPLVARTLQAVERQWIAEGFPKTARIRAIANQAVAAALSATRNS
jgi:poly(A) polymerase